MDKRENNTGWLLVLVIVAVVVCMVLALSADSTRDAATTQSGAIQRYIATTEPIVDAFVEAHNGLLDGTASQRAGFLADMRRAARMYDEHTPPARAQEAHQLMRGAMVVIIDVMQQRIITDANADLVSVAWRSATSARNALR